MKLFKRVKPTEVDRTIFHIFDRIAGAYSKKNTYTLINATGGVYGLLKKNNYDCIYYKEKKEILVNPLNNHKKPITIDLNLPELIKMYKRLF